ncbi:hypothetical protein [Clostridium sp.]|uniref:hypothetical protein n=1 Tax=Clostridium sp. TaxID=1506 RepID=UPI0032166A4D
MCYGYGNKVTVESIIDKNERLMLYNIIYIGVSAYKRLLKDNKELVNSASFKEIQTRLLNFVVKRQFEDDVLSLDFPYKVDFEEVNSFGNIALFLKNNKSKIQIQKTSKINKIYNSNKPAAYMLREAKVNSTYSREIKFFIDSDDEIGIKEDNRVFVVLGYGVKGREIDHIEFTIPNANLQGFIDTFNAMDEYKKLTSEVINDEMTEKKIVALKEEALGVIK